MRTVYYIECKGVKAYMASKAMSTQGIQLLYGTSDTTMANLVNIKDYGDLIGAPGTIDVTDLRDTQQTFINAILTSEAKTFTCNFTKETFQAVQTKANTPGFYAVRFKDKSGFVWQGEHSCGVPGKGVDDAVEFTVNVTNSTPVTFKDNIAATDDGV